MVLNSIKLKQLNTELVKNILKKSEYGTKNSIADATGLSVATCRNILEELVSSGEVKEIDMEPSTGGRPSRRFIYNDDYAYIALVYLKIEANKKSIVASVVNMKGKKHYENEADFEDISLKELDMYLQKMIDEYPEINVLSIGIPGVIKDGVIGLCDFEKLINFDLEQYLKDRFGKKITVENDVNAVVLGYYHYLEKQKPESLVYIYFPDEGCAGAGIMINGKILKGRTNFAGEISYLPRSEKREEQGSIQENSSLFIKMVTDVILSINCIINPECIVMSGEFITEEMFSELMESVTACSEPVHKPVVKFEQLMHESYMNGLMFAALQTMSCDIEVVERSYK